MSKDNKTSLEQATNELIEIVEVAKKKAKDDLTKEFPDKFDALLNEELKKSPKKELVKESVKDNKKEPVNGKKSNKKKESINEELDMREFSMGDIEEAFDDAAGAEEFSVVPDEAINAQPSVVANDNQGDSDMEDIVNAIDSLENFGDNMESQEIEQQSADPYVKFKELAEQMTQMVKEMDDKKMHEEFGAEFDQQMNGSFGESYKTSLGEEKCNELYEAFVANKQGSPYGEKVKATNISESESEDQPFKDKANPSTEQGKSIAEQKENGGEQSIPGRENGGPTDSMIKEEDEEGTEIEVKGDVEIEVEDRDEDEKVDEILTNTNAAQRKVQGGKSPNIDVAGKHRNPRTRPSQRSSGGVSENYKKRMETLIKENKRLTKENLVAKKSFVKAEKLVENYQTHLNKYRTQLREMAIFNTNLANVNNLFVNEEIALTGKDKISIINKFKTINSIDESDKIYGTILTYLKEGKQTITEDVEKKIVTGVAAEATPSTKKKIDEAIERTAYANDEHVNKIKSLMNYVDNARKN